jgi:hypothetical protein
MTTRTAAEIKAVIDEIIQTTDDSIGDVGKTSGYVYEGNDGMFVSAIMTAYEAYLAECELYGSDVADANYSGES